MLTWKFGLNIICDWDDTISFGLCNIPAGLEHSYSLSINRAVFCFRCAFSFCFVKPCVVLLIIVADSNL